MRRFFSICAVVIATASGGCAATAPSQISLESPDGSLPVAARMEDSSMPAGIPTGFVGFCMRNADQCDVSATATAALTPERWNLLETVNRRVNSEVRTLDDKEHYGIQEYWTIATDGYGDCEDFALTKRKALMEAGLPAGALRIAVVLTGARERHAVLTVNTDRGDFVLDNLDTDVRPWTAFNYVWLERQDPKKSWAWERLFADNSRLPAAAVASSR